MIWASWQAWEDLPVGDFDFDPPASTLSLILSVVRRPVRFDVENPVFGWT